MPDEFTIAVTGDAIINRRISVCRDEKFLSLIGVVRDADVAYTHFETLVHDYEGPELYPAAEAGWTWMRSPRYVVEELKWAGFDMVSHASNHCLDYLYGGLASTWQALDDGGMVHAGTGRHLGEAREARYLDTPKGRVALVSMCSSFVGYARAGEARRDMKGRPGLNPLRFDYVVDPGTLDTMKQLATKLGWWVTKVGDDWLFNPAGIHNTVYRVVEGKEPGVSTIADPADVDGNLRSISNAKRQADYVLVHIHNHEWNPDVGLHAPPKFVPPFARACIDAGADVFVAEGSHAPTRGIEVYRNRPIFYDPGDFISMSATVTRLPSDSYWRAGYTPNVRQWEATPADNFDSRAALPKPLSPPGGYFTAPVNGSVVAVCSFAEGRLAGVKLHPFTRAHGPRSRAGIPMMADPATGKRIIAYLGELSAPFGTAIDYRDGVGLVNVSGGAPASSAGG
jgi:poly-gamma-glutamate capsule biosynthesis protein CapA/YwtB (metallophosphatase superfamily)